MARTKLFVLIAALWTVLASGCGTLFFYDESSPNLYRGTQANVKLLRNKDPYFGPIGKVFGAVDLPLSFTLDTALMPVLLALDAHETYADGQLGLSR